VRWNPVDAEQAATASSDKTVGIWDVRTGKRVQSISTPGQNINMAWHPSGMLLATGSKVCRLFDECMHSSEHVSG
jgi:THO complex subunit 3